MIKAIIFDNVGVFTKKGLAKTLDTFSSRFGVDRIELEKRYKLLAKIANKGDMTANELYEQLIEDFKINASIDEIRKVHLDSYGEGRNLEMYQYAKELSKQFDIALFSNFSDAFDELNESLKLEEVFLTDRIFVSAKIKLKKPDREAFEYVLEKIGYKAEEVIFVDDREDNFESPLAMGMKGIVFKNVSQFKKDLAKILAGCSH